ncbi:uncharacterized protein LOC141903837 [Tubulanus polymorphus]|uniref:uncharacterized protein LOC141903837 n=1 Tax=Tubulanus polymorphus TaxID=672921 RepID=UPI003DA2512A
MDDDNSNLYFSRETITADDVDTICTALESHSVQILTLRKCEIEDHDFKRMMKSFRKCRSLLQLGLLEGMLNSVDRLKILSKAIFKNQNLRTLYIPGSDIGDENCGLLIKALAEHPNIVSLDLAECQLGDIAVKYLCDLLPPDKEKLGLSELSLSNNLAITSKGWTKLFIALAASSSLRVLKLDNNTIEDHGAGCLAVAMAANPELQILDVRNTGISSRGAKFFLNLLNNYPSYLKSLKLSENDIKEKTLDEINKCLEQEEEARRSCMQPQKQDSSDEETETINEEVMTEVKSENVMAGLKPKDKKKDKNDSQYNYYSAWGQPPPMPTSYGLFDSQSYGGAAPGMVSNVPSAPPGYGAGGFVYPESASNTYGASRYNSGGSYGYDQMGYGSSTAYGNYGQYGYGFTPTQPPYSGSSQPSYGGSAGYGGSGYGGSGYGGTSGYGSSGYGGTTPYSTSGYGGGSGSYKGTSSYGATSPYTKPSDTKYTDTSNKEDKTAYNRGQTDSYSDKKNIHDRLDSDRYSRGGTGSQFSDSSHLGKYTNISGKTDTTSKDPVSYGTSGSVSPRVNTTSATPDEVIEPSIVSRGTKKDTDKSKSNERSNVLKMFEELMKADATDDDLDAMKRRLNIATPPKVRDIEADFQRGRVVPMMRGRPSKKKHLGTIDSLSDSDSDM